MVSTVPVETAYDVRKRWGDELRLERCRQRLNQSDIAQRAGVAGPTVSKVENGRGSLDAFLKVAKALKVELLGESS